MSFVKKIEEHIVYQNPAPLLLSRQAKFPGLVQLADGELIALFEIGQAFDSADSQTFVSRSQDLGKTWQMHGPVYDMAKRSSDKKRSEALKPALLDDGRLIATGYCFYRPSPDTPIGNPETGGLLPGDNVISFSDDGGRSWSEPTAIKRSCPEIIEASGPAIQSSSGDIIMIGGVFKNWDGTNPTGQTGLVIRSKDKGKSWDTTTRYYPKGDVSPFESRICQMQQGRLVVMVWAFDTARNKNLNNMVVVSNDDGYSWSEPIDTGISAQASNLMWLGDDKLLTIHAHRTSDVGLYVRLIDFKDNKWTIEDESIIWGKAKAQDDSKDLIEQFADLKFGQPSLLKLDNGQLLATHWCFEDCMYKIKTHRLELRI